MLSWLQNLLGYQPEDNPLYADVDTDSFKQPGRTDSLGVIPRERFEKEIIAELDTTLLGGDAFGETIIRRMHGQSLRAWIDALESAAWQDNGFTYTPVEPIITDDDDNYRIYTDNTASYHQVAPEAIADDTIYRVYTEVLGPSLQQVTQHGSTLPSELEPQIEALEHIAYNELNGEYTDPALRRIHFAPRNICFHPRRPDSDEADTDIRLYLIDWAYAIPATPQKTLKNA